MKPVDPKKREQIIRAAIALFLEKGFDNASVSDITRSADVAKGTLYTHFKDKAHLIEQVFWHCHRRDVAACDEGLDAEATVIDKLLKRMENATRWAIAHGDEVAIERMYLNSTSLMSPEAKRYAGQAHFDSVDPLIKRGIADGTLRPLPPTLLGEVFFGVSSSFYYYFQKHPERFHDAEIRRHCRQTVMDAIGAARGHTTALPGTPGLVDTNPEEDTNP